MSWFSKQAETKRNPFLDWGFAALLASIVVSGNVGCGKGPDVPVIASGAEYSDLLDDAEKLSRAPLEKFEQKETLAAADRENLAKALKIFEGLIAFLPDQFGAYFGAGKIEMALDRPENAFPHFKKFIELAPSNPDEQFKPALAEAHYSVATIQETLANGPEDLELVKVNAERAYELIPQNANYLTLLASVRLREKKDEEAHKLVDAALALDPSHGRAKQLHSMMLPHD